MPEGRGGAGRAPLPSLRARQDPNDVRLLVTGHAFQAAAADRGLGTRSPFESVTHVHERFGTAERR